MRLSSSLCLLSLTLLLQCACPDFPRHQKKQQVGKNQCTKTPLSERGEVQASLQLGEGGLLCTSIIWGFRGLRACWPTLNGAWHLWLFNRRGTFISTEIRITVNFKESSFNNHRGLSSRGQQARSLIVKHCSKCNKDIPGQL